MTNEAPATLSMKEAVRLSGKSEATLRRLIAQKEVSARKDADGRYIIAGESLRHYLVTKAQPPPAAQGSSRHGASSRVRGVGQDDAHGVSRDEGVVTALRDLIAQLREDIERERRRADTLETRLIASQAERTQHMAEMRALLSKDLRAKEGVLSRWIRR
jgi:DNA-binding transcriptional regulator/RsmH inhibitor MraZ